MRAFIVVIAADQLVVEKPLLANVSGETWLQRPLLPMQENIADCGIYYGFYDSYIVQMVLGLVTEVREIYPNFNYFLTQLICEFAK